MSDTQATLVSVVVPSFNARRHLAQTLAAILGQTHERLEVIVVDDGSTDGTADWVQSSFPSVRVIRQRNAGVSVARNTGLEAAGGEFISFVDQDDVWHPMQVERQLQCLKAHPQAVAVATPYAFWHPQADGTWTPQPLQPDQGLRLVPGYEGWTYHLFLLDCWALTSATLIRVAELRDVGGFDPTRTYAEDWDLWLRLSRRHPFLQLAWPPVSYRQHPQQGSRMVRPVDHRCDLLMQAARKHGLSSPDGQGIAPERFKATMARYRAEFGYFHLQHGSRKVACKSLMHAWLMQPWRLRWLALACAGSIGWRPRHSA